MTTYIRYSLLQPSYVAVSFIIRRKVFAHKEIYLTVHLLIYSCILQLVVKLYSIATLSAMIQVSAFYHIAVKERAPVVVRHSLSIQGRTMQALYISKQGKSKSYEIVVLCKITVSPLKVCIGRRPDIIVRPVAKHIQLQICDHEPNEHKGGCTAKCILKTEKYITCIHSCFFARQRVIMYKQTLTDACQSISYLHLHRP